jgi:hypothetical protein
MKKTGTKKFLVWMAKGIFWGGFSLTILEAESMVESRSLPGIEGEASRGPAARSKILSPKQKDKEIRKGNFRFSDISTASESEEEPSPSPRSRKKMFGRFWDKYNPWRDKEKRRAFSQTYSTSGESSGYETEGEGQESSSPVSLNEVSFDLKEEDPKESATSETLSERREGLVSPLTLQTLDRGDTERALKKILEQKADDYDAKGENFTRDLKEFQEMVDEFIKENPVLSFMTEEDRNGFIKANARANSGASPLKPTRSKVVF